jgi:rRNA-processing protein FCF1
MMAVQFHLDVASQLQEILPRINFTVPSFVIDELENIKIKSRGKTRAAAAVALKTAKFHPLTIKNIPLSEGELVDDALLRISPILCTNDRELRRRARERKIPVVYLRQRKYLALDGYLDV